MIIVCIAQGYEVQPERLAEQVQLDPVVIQVHQADVENARLDVQVSIPPPVLEEHI